MAFGDCLDSSSVASAQQALRAAATHDQDSLPACRCWSRCQLEYVLILLMLNAD